MSTGNDTIGFIGLGNMGWPMATNLARSPYDVIGFDADASVCEEFDAVTGCTIAPSLAALAAAVDIIVTMLPTGQLVRQVVLEDERGALAKGLGDGGLVIDMSSSEPVGTRALGKALAAAGVALVDAPVSGGVPKAEDGTLAIMIGADDDGAVAAATPILEKMGDRIFRAGPLGAGHAAKALNNYVAAAAFTAASEALIVGEAFGLERETLLTIINNSTGRNFNSEFPIKDHVLPRSFASGFKLGLMNKDVTIAADLATAMGVSAPLSEFVGQCWDEANTALGPDADFTSAITHWEARQHSDG